MLGKKSTKQLLKNKNLLFSKIITISVVFIIAFLGVHYYFSSHAASPFVTISANKGTLAGSAINYSDTGASDGIATRFGTSNSSGFITTSGTNFMLAGKVFQYIGFNFYGAADTCYNGVTTPAQLDAYFARLPSNGVTRIWAFQTYGTSGVNTVLTEAAKYHQHLILTLGDDDASCGETDGAISGNQKGKMLAFYQTGWQGKYLSWVNTIVPMFKNNPSIMMWEVANEPGNVGDRPTEAVMQAYFEGTSDAIRAIDTNHLIGVGTNYPGAVGTYNEFVKALNIPNIDAISVHDYSYDYEHGAIVSSNFTTAKLVSQQINKPFYVGETGVKSGPTCTDVPTISLTYADRVTFLKAKTDAYIKGGAGGVGFWEYEPTQASWLGTCPWEFYPTDPFVSVVQNYVIP